MAPKLPSDLAEKIVVRCPDGLRDRLAERARANGRSSNAEAVMALEAWLVGPRTKPGLYVEKTYDPAVGSGDFLAAMADYVAQHPGLRITLDLRPDDEAEPVRTIGPEDRLADVGEVEGGAPYPRRIEGPPPPPEVQAERERRIEEARRWRDEEEKVVQKKAERA